MNSFLHQRRGVVKPQNRPPVKFQLYVTQFVVLIQKHKFSSKLGRFNDSKLYPIVKLPYIHYMTEKAKDIELFFDK
jgi:hypothetical protein